MSKLSEDFEVSLPADEAWQACRVAVAQVGWGIAEMDDARLVPRVGVGITRNPSKIELLRGDGTDQSTRLHINGSIMGVGPIQKRHLRAEMNQLRNAIEAAAAR